jgi:hypothetical protein
MPRVDDANERLVDTGDARPARHGDGENLVGPSCPGCVQLFAGVEDLGASLGLSRAAGEAKQR